MLNQILQIFLKARILKIISSDEEDEQQRLQMDDDVGPGTVASTPPLSPDSQLTLFMDYNK